MAKKIVEIENVSKKYRLSHGSHEAYATLVGTLSRQAKRCIQKIRHPFTGASAPFKSVHEDFWALQNVNLSIEEGDRVGIVGGNGAGKSTLLKILSRITLPTTGRIKLRGRVASLLEVGTGFHPELTGRENIFLNGAILGMRHQEIKQKFDEIAAFAEIENFLDTPVKRFSSGMYMRLGFAIAAHLDPDLLIVDEVLAVGDAKFQAKCLQKLNRLSGSGRTVIFVSHDIGSALSLCNKGVFLEKGIVKASGSMDQCVNAYMQTCHAHTLCWEGNAGDEHIRFHRVRLTPEKENQEFFYQGEKIRVEIEYETLRPTPDLFFGVGVWNQRNQLLARAHTIDDVDSEQNFVTPGRHCAFLIIEADLFHEGEYLLKVDSSIHNKKKILNDEIILKFPIYPIKKNTRFAHSPGIEGVSLGKNWQLRN